MKHPLLGHPFLQMKYISILGFAPLVPAGPLTLASPRYRYASR